MASVEALARAYMISGNKEQKDHNLNLTRIAAESIAKAEDRNYLLLELEKIK